MHERWIHEAVDLARAGMRDKGGGPFGALVVCDERVVGRGNNQVTEQLDPTAHAEIVAIREACRVLSRFDLRGCILYTSCEPCPMCLGAIYWSRPAHVFYAANAADAASAGFDDAFIYKELSRPPAERHIPMTQFMREESLAVFEAWKTAANKKRY